MSADLYNPYPQPAQDDHTMFFQAIVGVLLLGLLLFVGALLQQDAVERRAFSCGWALRQGVPSYQRSGCEHYLEWAVKEQAGHVH